MASKKVILYFESPSDALKFTLAAGSVMAGDIHDASDGLIHEMHLAIAPVLLGSGEHLLGGIDLTRLGFECTEHVPTASATHVVLTRRK